MYAAVALAIIEAVAKYVADQYEQRQENARFEKLKADIIDAINSAKLEIIAALIQINDDRIMDSAESIIELFKSYDRHGTEYVRLFDITSADGIRAHLEIERRMVKFPAYDIGFHKFFFPWMLVTCARAFAYVELTDIGQASDYDDALQQFELLRDECEKALSGLKIINDRRFSTGVSIVIDTMPGEDGIGAVGYYFDRDFVDVEYFSAKPYKRDEYELAQEAAHIRLEEHRSRLHEESSERKAIQSAKDQACRHVICN